MTSDMIYAPVMRSNALALPLRLVPTLNLLIERPGTAHICDHRVPPKLMNGVTHPVSFAGTPLRRYCPAFRVIVLRTARPHTW